VVDADGLNALAGSVELLKAKKAVITPHPGEMARLIGSSISKVLAAPEEISKELATTLGIVVILKGAPSIIASPTGDIFYNASGNPGMATGGTGDVLTGMIGEFLAQGCSLLDAALLGVYMHGLSGDIAFRHYGTCLAACDLIDCIPDAFIELLEAEAGDNGGINELILNLYWLKHPLIDTYR
jgi:NAD(P)H-hydrate epimerase